MVDGPFFESLYPPAKEMPLLRKKRDGGIFILIDQSYRQKKPDRLQRSGSFVIRCTESPAWSDRQTVQPH